MLRLATNTYISSGIIIHEKSIYNYVGYVIGSKTDMLHDILISSFKPDVIDSLINVS